MPIQILDNFEVNIAKPIDNRFVVGSQSFYTNKEQIPYRYPGLRIWDLNDNFPYIWTGVTWSNENQSGSVIGSGIVNRLARFTGTNNIGSSIVFDNGTSIAIDSTTPLTTDKLFINGNGRNVRLSGTGSFIGNGSGLTTLNATNITSGSLSLTRITDGSSGQILVRGLSNAEFVNASSITVGTASTLTINPASDSAIYHFPFFSGTTGLPINKQIFATSSSIQIRPNTGNVGIGTSPSTTNRLTVSGTVSITGNVGIGTPLTTNILTVSGTVSVSGATRVNRLGNTGLPGFVHGYNTSAINFETFATSTSTEISIYNPSNTNFKTRILQYPNYFELLTSERMFFTVSNSGARDFFFGREGQPTTQIRFIMDNSPDDLPSVGGKGVFISQNLRVNGTLSKSSGTFQIEHPLESKRNTHTLVHSFIEGPQADLIYRGKINLVDGKVEINIDRNSNMTEGTFVSLNRDVQCFTSNESGWSSVKGKITGNILTIESSDNDSTDLISWIVIGERKDRHMFEASWTDENGKVIVEPDII